MRFHHKKRTSQQNHSYVDAYYTSTVMFYMPCIILHKYVFPKKRNLKIEVLPVGGSWPSLLILSRLDAVILLSQVLLVTSDRPTMPAATISSQTDTSSSTTLPSLSGPTLTEASATPDRPGKCAWQRIFYTW